MKRTTASFALASILLSAGPLVAAEAMAPEVVTSSQDLMEYLPQVAYNSNHDEYLVVWHDVDPVATPQRRILARRLDRYGRPKSGAIVVSPTGDNRDRAQPAIAYDSVNDRYLLVYVFDYNGNGSDMDVRGRFMSWNAGSLGNELTIADTLASEWVPQVDFSRLSNKFLVTWSRNPAGGLASVRGSLVTTTGPGAEFLIASHASQDRTAPDVAYQPYGDNFLVVYGSGLDIFGTIVTAAGAVGSEIGIAAWPDTEAEASVASCDNYQYIVAWHSSPGGGNKEVYVRFLYGDGTVYTAPIYISGTTAHEQRPDVTCIDDDIEYLVTFEQQYVGGQFGISGRRITATQVLRPEFPIRPVYGGETGVTSQPSVAGSGAGWLATWEHDRQGSAYQDIHARAVWTLFADGFEWGNTNSWSLVQP